EADGLFQGPARRLDDPALDLVDHAVGVDDLPRVDGGHDARDAHHAGLLLDLDVGGHRAVAGEVLVLGEGEAAAAHTVAPAARSPPGRAAASRRAGRPPRSRPGRAYPTNGAVGTPRGPRRPARPVRRRTTRARRRSRSPPACGAPTYGSGHRRCSA